MANPAGPKRSLLWGSGSPPAWRVLLALHEKELSFDSQLIEFSNGGHKTEEALKKNPRGQVPTLTDGNIVLCESLAAIIYLEETYGKQGTPLLPPLSQAADRAQVWQRTMESENLAKSATGLFHISSDADEKALSKSWTDLEKEVKRWELILETDKTQYIAGPAFTLADVAIVPYVMWLKRGNMDLSKYPWLAKYANLVAARPTVVKTMPPHWMGTTASFFEKKGRTCDNVM